MNEQVKLAKSEEQPIRKYRTVFTSTKGLFKKKLKDWEQKQPGHQH